MAENMLVEVITKPCIECGNRTTMFLDLDKYNSWINGKHIQDVWPEKSVSERELLMTGIHEGCWNKIFGEGEE